MEETNSERLRKVTELACELKGRSFKLYVLCIVPFCQVRLGIYILWGFEYAAGGVASWYLNRHGSNIVA